MGLARGDDGATDGAVVLRTINVGALDNMSICCFRVVGSLHESPFRCSCYLTRTMIELFLKPGLLIWTS